MLYDGRKVLVLGLARSGVAVARLLQKLGASVTVSDALEREQVSEQVMELESLGIPVITGGHPLELLEGCDLLVKNPGIPYDRPILQAARKRGISVVTEVEIAYTVTSAPIIGITGSNGKTTTTILVAEMLRTSGVANALAGNVGTPMSAVAPDADTDTWLVTELSSFQLLGTNAFRPKIAALLNLYPTHLDYHGSMEEYIQAKSRLFANQEASDIAVLNADHPLVESMAAHICAEVWWVSSQRALKRGVWVRDGMMIHSRDGVRREEILPVREIALRGSHNLENAVTATAVALAAGASSAAVAQTLRTFAGVEHRLEFVRELAGVQYYNNSKATNPQATIRALDSFLEPVICILGGLERGDDLAPLLDPVRRRVKAVVVLGESGPRMLKMADAAGILRRERVSSIEEAVQKAKEMAEPGDVVLLSPAAASWDMFQSFEERGRIFKEVVHKL